MFFSVQWSGLRLITIFETVCSCLSCFIVDLRIGQNKFEGNISALTGLKNLEILHVNDNKFEGTIPSMFDYLFRLHEVFLQGNKLSGPVPRDLTHLQGLSKSFAAAGVLLRVAFSTHHSLRILPSLLTFLSSRISKPFKQHAYRHNPPRLWSFVGCQDYRSEQQ
jgi:hypothetical protein